MSSKIAMEMLSILRDRLEALMLLKPEDAGFKEARQAWLADYEELNEMELHEVLERRLARCFEDYLVWSRAIDTPKPKPQDVQPTTQE